MRESEKKVGRADNNLPGARSTANGETKEPEKVVEDVTDDNGPRHGGSAEWGSEGGGGASYYDGEKERKERS